MTKPNKKPTDQDLFNEAKILSAVSFSASIFAFGRHNTVPTRDLASARAMAAKMTSVVTNGRRAIVYAITPEGAAVLVPDAWAPPSA